MPLHRRILKGSWMVHNYDHTDGEMEVNSPSSTHAKRRRVQHNTTEDCSTSSRPPARSQQRRVGGKQWDPDSRHTAQMVTTTPSLSPFVLEFIYTPYIYDNLPPDSEATFNIVAAFTRIILHCAVHTQIIYSYILYSYVGCGLVVDRYYGPNTAV